MRNPQVDLAVDITHIISNVVLCIEGGYILDRSWIHFDSKKNACSKVHSKHGDDHKPCYFEEGWSKIYHSIVFNGSVTGMMRFKERNVNLNLKKTHSTTLTAFIRRTILSMRKILTIRKILLLLLIVVTSLFATQAWTSNNKFSLNYILKHFGVKIRHFPKRHFSIYWDFNKALLKPCIVFNSSADTSTTQIMGRPKSISWFFPRQLCVNFEW